MRYGDRLKFKAHYYSLARNSQVSHLSVLFLQYTLIVLLSHSVAFEKWISSHYSGFSAPRSSHGPLQRLMRLFLHAHSSTYESKIVNIGT